MRKAVFCLSAALAFIGFLGVQKYLGAKEAKEKKGKYTIKQVMKIAHNEDDGLMQKIAGGEATKAEKEKLLELYRALSEDKPPKGSVDDWKKRTSAIVKAAQNVVDDKEGAVTELKKAVKCAACHAKHRVVKDDD
jgi:hypothetical protein